METKIRDVASLIQTSYVCKRFLETIICCKIIEEVQVPTLK